MTVLQLSPNALTALVLVVMAVAVVIGWRSLRTQIRRIEPAPQDAQPADSETLPPDQGS